MSGTILVSTRKGLFVLERRKDVWSIARHAFPGDNIALTSVDPRDGAWYAVLDLGHFGNKLQRSIDRGATWSECAVPTYAEGDQVITGDGKPPAAATLRLIWSLEAGGAGQTGRLWAGTIPGGLFRSDDCGASWQMVRSLWEMPERKQWFGGGFDQPGIHSICVDPNDARMIRVAISTGGVWGSNDDGATWEQCAQGMRAAYMPPDRAYEPNVQDVHHMVQCPGQPDVFWAQHHNGVFRNSGGDWQEIENVPPSVFGFAVAVHPRDADTAWFVPATKDERRIPVDGKVVVARTRDGGRSFDVLRNGLPQHDAYDLVLRHALAIDGSGECLAFGSSTGGVWISEDQGDRWSMLDARLPPVYAVAFAA
ncbi:MAG: exo-alpha-sialidase [Proteobacteria bacterium]|nr:exo-alpha-sialidase [Pseudomonadota bacterium]